MTTAVLLTGATGFVGRSLAASLSRHRNTVIAAMRRRSADLPENVRQIVSGDLAEEFDWTPALKGVDVVVHLAARVHVMRDLAADPLSEFRRTNVDATLDLARHAARCGVRRFIFISSIGVNGAGNIGEPYSEASAPCPHSPYAQSKYEAEQALRKLCADTTMEFVIIRPPLVYGPDAPGNFRMMLNYIDKGIPLPLGSINNRRSMVFLDNLVDLIRVCLTHPAAANQEFLAADAKSVSTPGMIKALATGMGKRARLFGFPVSVLRLGAGLAGRQNMYQQLCGSLEVDISKAGKMLGWIPPISIYDGLRLSAEGYLDEKSF
jgi:nucleoside-diphosphate-sugar epimerase